MSRIGKDPINLPSGVSVDITPEMINISGPKGNLSQFTMPGIDIIVADQQIIVSRQDDQKVHRSKHGLMRSLLSNMVEGVSQGYSKKLEINGVGFKVNFEGKTLKLNVGFSHTVEYQLPDDVSASVEQNIITISGINKQQVGQVAAEIRSIKKPEPYKGKGIKYIDERIIRKSGKSGKDK